MIFDCSLNLIEKCVLFFTVRNKDERHWVVEGFNNPENISEYFNKNNLKWLLSVRWFFWSAKKLLFKGVNNKDLVSTYESFLCLYTELLTQAKDDIKIVETTNIRLSGATVVIDGTISINHLYNDVMYIHTRDKESEPWKMNYFSYNLEKADSKVYQKIINENLEDYQFYVQSHITHTENSKCLDGTETQAREQQKQNDQMLTTTM